MRINRSLKAKLPFGSYLLQINTLNDQTSVAWLIYKPQEKKRNRSTAQTLNLGSIDL